jgi:radial spoke head protein 4A
MIGDWAELPLITPEQLISARKVKYFFTGDLERDVITNPHFIGKEKHLVRNLESFFW